MADLPLGSPPATPNRKRDAAPTSRSSKRAKVDFLGSEPTPRRQCRMHLLMDACPRNHFDSARAKVTLDSDGFAVELCLLMRVEGVPLNLLVDFIQFCERTRLCPIPANLANKDVVQLRSAITRSKQYWKDAGVVGFESVDGVVARLPTLQAFQDCLRPTLESGGCGINGSVYKAVHSVAQEPKDLDAALAALKRFVKHVATRESLPDNLVSDFLEVLLSESLAEHIAKGDKLTRGIEKLVCRWWSSAAVLGEKELCSHINSILRADEFEGVFAAMPLIQALTSLVTSRGGLRTLKVDEHEAYHWLYRGTGMPASAVEMFTVGLTYRCPFFLAASEDESTAREFASRAAKGGRQRVVFRIKCADKSCHAHTIQEFSLIKNEAEHLHTPWSVFRVEGVATVDGVKAVDLLAARDNKAYDRDPEVAALPVMTWH